MDCKGTGEKLKEKERFVITISSQLLSKSWLKPSCKKCKGEKVVKEKTRQEIFIEKGMSARQRIVLAGAGDQSVRSLFDSKVSVRSSTTT